MKKILFILLAVSVTYFTSCKKEDNHKAPGIQTPTQMDVEAGTSVDVTFNYTAEAGFKSSSVTASNGTAVISTNGTAGATSGSIVVTFTASDSQGAGSVTLSVMDNDNQTTDATAVMNVMEEVTVIEVASNITSDQTWETGKTYILKTRIAVVAGATLTIQPGVVVKGEAGTGANASALLIARDATIMAEGSPTQPIIFTSIADEIQPGQLASPNLDPDLNGLWGGVIVCGNAKISADASPSQIEGIPPSDQNGLYGGDNDDDNSGVIRYVSIRHGGANIGEGNEINGLTLGGVGRNTIIENVEIIANQDDGTEWFGGTVNVKNLLIWNPGDDGVDTDQAWAGTLDNFVVIAGNDTDHTLEIDGPEGSYLAGHTVKNGSIKGSPQAQLGDFRDGARGNFMDIYFFNFPDPATDGRGNLSLSGDESNENFANGFLTFSNLQCVQANASVSLSDVFLNGTDVDASFVTSQTKTVGADVSQFGWTWAAEDGQLNDF